MKDPSVRELRSDGRRQEMKVGRRWRRGLSILLLAIACTQCDQGGSQNRAFEQLSVPDHAERMQEVSVRESRAANEPKPDSKLHIRLKRDAKGGYSWEITGSDPKQIIDSDRQLRKRFQAGAGASQETVTE